MTIRLPDVPPVGISAPCGARNGLDGISRECSVPQPSIPIPTFVKLIFLGERRERHDKGAAAGRAERGAGRIGRGDARRATATAATKREPIVAISSGAEFLEMLEAV